MVDPVRRTLASLLRAAAERLEPPVLTYELDRVFWELYEAGVERVRDPANRSPSRRRLQPPRFYNLVQISRSVYGLEGEMIELGCYRGLSSFLLCHYLRRHDPDFRGEGYHIVDSFAGLSEPTPGKDSWSYREGMLKADLEEVRGVLSDFPRITFHRGWVPEVLATLPRVRYRFVHVDVDLYRPTLSSLEYFYPRLVPGGILVVDDYGYLDWGGAKEAGDEFCAAEGVQLSPLSTGNAFIVKKGG